MSLKFVRVVCFGEIIDGSETSIFLIDLPGLISIFLVDLPGLYLFLGILIISYFLGEVACDFTIGCKHFRVPRIYMGFWPVED